MSSGFLLLRNLFRSKAQRLDELRGAGLVIDLNDISEYDEVVEIGLGYGPEFWKIRPGYAIRPREQLVEGGWLILADGQPLEERHRLAFLRRPIARILFKE